MNFDNYKKQLNEIVQGARTQQEAINQLVIVGARYAEQNNNGLYLTHLLNKLENLSSLRFSRLKGHILALVENSEYRKDKTGAFIIRPVKGEKMTINSDKLGLKWWDFEAPQATPRPFDVEAYIERVLKHLDKNGYTAYSDDLKASIYKKEAEQEAA